MLTYTEVVPSGFSFDFHVSRDISSQQTAKVGKLSEAGVRFQYFRQLAGRSTPLA